MISRFTTNKWHGSRFPVGPALSYCSWFQGRGSRIWRVNSGESSGSKNEINVEILDIIHDHGAGISTMKYETGVGEKMAPRKRDRNGQ